MFGEVQQTDAGLVTCRILLRNKFNFKLAFPAEAQRVTDIGSLQPLAKGEKRLGWSLTRWQEVKNQKRKRQLATRSPVRGHGTKCGGELFSKSARPQARCCQCVTQELLKGRPLTSNTRQDASWQRTGVSWRNGKRFNTFAFNSAPVAFLFLSLSLSRQRCYKRVKDGSKHE